MKNKIYYLILFFLVAVFPFPSLMAATSKPPKAAGQSILQRMWNQPLKTASAKRYFPETSSPIVINDMIYVGTHSSIFYALNAANRGQVVWSFQSKGPIANQAISDGSNIFFGNNKGVVYALNRNTGDLEWELYVGGEVLARPTILGNLLYIVTTSREVYAIDKRVGELKWTTFIKGFEKKFTMRGNAAVQPTSAGVFVSFADGLVARLSLKDGAIEWSRQLSPIDAAHKDIDATLLVDNKYLYAVGYFGLLFKLEQKSGATVWEKDIKSGIDMVGDEKSLYISTENGNVVAVEKENGYRQWEVELHSGVLSAPLLMDNHVFVSSSAGRAYVLDANTGSVLQSLPLASGLRGNPVTDGQSIYGLSSTGKLVSFRRVSE